MNDADAAAVREVISEKISKHALAWADAAAALLYGYDVELPDSDDVADEILALLKKREQHDAA